MAMQVPRPRASEVWRSSGLGRTDGWPDSGRVDEGSPPAESPPAALHARFVALQEEERRRIARELHDVVGQALTAVKLSLESLERPSGGDDPAAGPRGSHVTARSRPIAESIATVDRVLAEIRGFALDLRPAELDDLGLAPALRRYVDRRARAAGIRGRFVADVLEERYPAAVESACFRIAQEAVTNVIRHARAASITVSLKRRCTHLDLQVRDDGVGFGPVDGDDMRTWLGLVGMSERAELVGARLVIRSGPERGTSVFARFPLPARSGPIA